MQMNKSLYLVTDESVALEALIHIVEKSIQAGVSFVQLREKNRSGKEFYERAMQVKKITDAYKVPLLINDRIDIALAVGAAGVHIGQQDLPLSVVKKMLPSSALIGVSAATVEEAQAAERDGANYIGVGAVFATRTKKDAKPLAEGMLTTIAESVKIPVVAIGGIQATNIHLLQGEKIAGAAVVSAITQASDPYEAALALKAAFSTEQK